MTDQTADPTHMILCL